MQTAIPDDITRPDTRAPFTPTPAAAVGSINLTTEQGDAVDRLVQGTKDRLTVGSIQTLGGYAGTGKTVVVSELSRRLPGYAVCAYTGKAADILRRKGLSASTIHSLIYRPETDPRTKRVKFNLIRPQELSAQGFIVDEASMVGADILRDLQAFRRPIIAVGDHGQLPPVGNDAGLMADPMIRLEQIHRNAGPIARFAEHLRKGYGAAEWKEAAEPGKPRVYVVEAEEATDDRLARAHQIICAYNKTRVALNRRTRRALNITDGSPEADAIPVVGDRVMCLRNNRDFGVFNGQQGVVADIRTRGYEMLFRPSFASAVWLLYHPEGFDKEKPPEYDNNDRGRFNTEAAPIPFDYAYAATCHKCQGDEFGKVVVMEERCGMWEHSRWAYTAASRGKEAILWVKQGRSASHGGKRRR